MVYAVCVRLTDGSYHYMKKRKGLIVMNAQLAKKDSPGFGPMYKEMYKNPYQKKKEKKKKKPFHRPGDWPKNWKI